jgi:CheY-like chemotaxis protein
MLGGIMPDRKRLGEIFIEQGLITEKTLERVLERSRILNRKLGTVLEDMGLITGDELANAIARQYGLGLAANFARFSFPPELLKMLPADEALQCLLFPLKLENGKLALAMYDPQETKIVANLAANNDVTVVPYIAPRKDILAAISRHYLGRELSTPVAKTILIVEDDNLMYAQLHDVLVKENYRMIRANDGFEGYKMAVSECPHVIITDKEMPKLGGYGLLESLRNLPETSHTPVILLTGASDAVEEARAFEKGFFDFITKPVRSVTLSTRVKRAFQYLEHGYMYM